MPVLAAKPELLWIEMAVDTVETGAVLGPVDSGDLAAEKTR